MSAPAKPPPSQDRPLPARQTNRRDSVLRALTLALAALGLLVVIVTFTPLDYWWATWLAGDAWDAPHGEVLVVLTGSTLEDGTIGESSYWRAVYAVRAWREDDFKAILVSGGPPVAPAAKPMLDFILSQGVPAGAVLLETQSLSTRDSALYCKPILSQFPGRKVLLTSDYHMFRARRAFSSVGLDLVPCPFPDVRKRYQQRRFRWDAFLDLCQETAKICYYQLHGWL
jgi:uncharacterized SAM-binding protein YcdF (DUF218 family)